ncbi:MAG: hypothetical protein EBQ92_00260 [Proteobacteria bacterium]|nr:hypothetical protein [Pseudomonadota bacterium]
MIKKVNYSGLFKPFIISIFFTDNKKNYKRTRYCFLVLLHITEIYTFSSFANLSVFESIKKLKPTKVVLLSL